MISFSCDLAGGFDDALFREQRFLTLAPDEAVPISDGRYAFRTFVLVRLLLRALQIHVTLGSKDVTVEIGDPLTPA